MNPLRDKQLTDKDIQLMRELIIRMNNSKTIKKAEESNWSVDSFYDRKLKKYDKE